MSLVTRTHTHLQNAVIIDSVMQSHRIVLYTHHYGMYTTLYGCAITAKQTPFTHIHTHTTLKSIVRDEKANRWQKNQIATTMETNVSQRAYTLWEADRREIDSICLKLNSNALLCCVVFCFQFDWYIEE